MLDFNPFNCDFDEINESSLSQLIEKSIAESWYVEYKEFFVTDYKKLAKSISAFANAEGGWFFMGIKSENKTNVAEEICGIEIDNSKNLVDQISKIIVSNISPIPDFEIKLIELKSGKYVVIIKVEEGIEPPYITSSGSIHQREHNANNPVKDRYLIEKMYEKTKNNHEIIENFSTIDYGETKGQVDEDQPYLELYLFPSPINCFSFSKFIEPDFFDKVAKAFFSGMNLELDVDGVEYKTNLSLDFNAIYSSFDSLVIRPIIDETIIYKGTTVELFRNGNMKMLLPICTFRLKDAPSKYNESELIKYLLDRFCPYEEMYENDFMPLCGISTKPRIETSRKNSEFSDWFQLIDGHEFILIVWYIVNLYQNLLKDSNYPEINSLGFRARISNSWRKIMFFDNSKYLAAIKKYNIPATPKAVVEVPSFKNGNYLRVENEKYSFVRILEFIFEGIGFPRNEKLDYLDILLTSINNLKKE